MSANQTADNLATPSVVSQADRPLPIDLTPVSWVAHAELAYEHWLRAGSRLGLAGRSAAWWIGDWVQYGTARYGEKYAAAARVTGYDRQTLMNMVYVASRFEFSRRRENLSWSHHAELAPLNPGDQEQWLERAISERLSVRDLREELSVSHGRGSTRTLAADKRQAAGRASVRTTDPREHRASPTAPEATVTCPVCHHTFAPDDHALSA